MTIYEVAIYDNNGTVVYRSVCAVGGNVLDAMQAVYLRELIGTEFEALPPIIATPHYIN